MPWDGEGGRMPEARSSNVLRVPQQSSHGEGSISPRSSNSLTSPNTANSGRIRRKLVVIGDGACGKTSMLISYTNGSFPVMYMPTVFENYVASIPVDNHVVEMSLWDTAGQEDYDRIRPLSYTETSVLLICFAIDMPNSLTSWIDEVVRYCEGVPRILVGCKMDIRQNSPNPSLLVSKEQAMEVAEKIQAYKYLECSAKSGEALKEVFEQAARASLLSKKKFQKAQKNGSSITNPKQKRKFCSIN